LKKVDNALRQFLVPNAPQLKFHDAIDWYHRAARAFIVAGEWQDSAEAYAKASDMCAHMGMAHEAAVFSLRAADAMKKIDPGEAITHFRNAVSLYCELGRFFTAGNIQKGVAQMYEEDHNYEECCESYRQASDYYMGENKEQASNQCLLKVAELSALLERFDYATETFEKVALSARDHNMQLLNVNDYFLRAGLCQLANGGPIRKGLHSHKVLRYYLKKWVSVEYSFVYSREYMFLTNLLDLIPGSDLDHFADHVYNFDNVCKLDLWCLRMLNRVREDIEEDIERKIRKAAKEEMEAMRKQEEVCNHADCVRLSTASARHRHQHDTALRPVLGTVSSVQCPVLVSVLVLAFVFGCTPVSAAHPQQWCAYSPPAFKLLLIFPLVVNLIHG